MTSTRSGLLFPGPSRPWPQCRFKGETNIFEAEDVLDGGVPDDTLARALQTSASAIWAIVFGAHHKPRGFIEEWARLTFVLPRGTKPAVVSATFELPRRFGASA